MLENLPSEDNSFAAEANSDDRGIDSACRASVRSRVGESNEFVKNGGLDIAKSKADGLLSAKSCTELCSMLIFCEKGEFLAFSFACETAFSQISMPETVADGHRWASIKAIKPEPVPISIMRRAFSMFVHAPSSTPSVPTFIAQRSW